MLRPRNLTRLTLWLALLLLVSATSLRARSAGPPLPLAQYRAQLAAAISDLEATPEAEAEAVIAKWQERFAAITQVELPNGEEVAMRSILDDLNPLGAQELGDETMLSSPTEVALARLQGALAQIDAAANDNTVARLAILANILARPAFNTPLSLWDRFWQWLENLLSNLLPESQAGPGSGWLAFLIRALTWLLTILIVAATIWLLSYWLQRLLRSFVTDARIHQLAGDDDLPRSAAEARQQARVAAQSGLYRDAVRRLYLAALLQLSEHDLIHYERSLTNREVLIGVPNDSPIRLHLEPVVATFDQVWYGVREPDQATFTAYEQEIDSTGGSSRARCR